MHGRAQRHGAVVCAQVRAVVRTDGLRRQVCVRFVDGLDPGLRDELERLREARGARGLRFAEALHPIDFELRSSSGEHRLTGCRLAPPIACFAPIEQVDFRVRST